MSSLVTIVGVFKKGCGILAIIPVILDAQGKGSKSGMRVGNYNISVESPHLGTKLYSDNLGQTEQTSVAIAAQDGNFQFFTKGDGKVTVKLVLDDGSSTPVTDTEGILFRRSDGLTPTVFYGTKKFIGQTGETQVTGLPSKKAGETEDPSVFFTISETTLANAGYKLATGQASTVEVVPTEAGADAIFTVTAFAQNITVLQADTASYATIDSDDATADGIPATGTFTFDGPQA